MSSDTKGAIARFAACFIGYFVIFALVGQALSHYLFLWLDIASSPASSQTTLWALYVFMAIAAAFVLLKIEHPLEGLLLGVLAAFAAGGMYVIGYSNIFVAPAVAILVAAGVLFLRQGPLRAGYIGVCVGLIVPLCMFAVSAAGMASVKGLSYSSSASGAVTPLEWAQMSPTQRESFLAGVIQTEASRLNTGSIRATQAIMPKEVLATVLPDGSVVVNYAAVRVQSPDPAKVVDYEKTFETDWVYERLTSHREITYALVHSVAHVYQSQRVAGQVKEQMTWPYEDADAPDGTNAVLDEWAAHLPVDPLSDTLTFDNKLEGQAWGYASNRLTAYIG